MKEIFELLLTANWVNYVFFAGFWIGALYMVKRLSKLMTYYLWMRYVRKSKSTSGERKAIDEALAIVGCSIMAMAFVPAGLVINSLELPYQEGCLLILACIFISGVLVAIPGYVIYRWISKRDIRNYDIYENMNKYLHDNKEEDK